MRFYEFLNENITAGGQERVYSSPRSRSIDIDKAFDIISKKCGKISYYYTKEQNPFIYRAVEHSTEHYLYTDPSKGKKRLSANTYNFMTLLLDNLPSWSNFPKRSESLICTTDKDEAEVRSGGTYLVFPFNNAKIAECPEDDIWNSFDDPLGDNSVDTFNQEILWAFESNGIDIDKAEKDFETFIEAIRKSMFDFNKNDIPLLRNIIGVTNEKEIINYFDKHLNPKDNEFNLISPGKKLRKNVECWTDSESILVNVNDLDNPESLLDNLDIKI